MVDAKRIAEIYKAQAPHVLATLIRLFNGSFDLAEDGLQDAFAAALKQWPESGLPENPKAWLISAGRFKVIDRLRKRSRFDASVQALTQELERSANRSGLEDEPDICDDALRLIFTCCHPSLSMEARVALTLREICGLTTEEIAAAFLLPTPTLAQRVVRAKAKIRDANIPYEVPEQAEMAERLDGVLQVIYLVFNEGYSASSGEQLMKHALCTEAIRLGRSLQAQLPDAEVVGLLALMLLQYSRRRARFVDGELISLKDQDRTLWDKQQITEGCALVVQALRTRSFGTFTLQAAIAAVHAEAATSEATDWREICGLYDVLLRANPSPIVALNRAVAVAMRDGPAAGLELIDALLQQGELTSYHLAHVARADLCRRLGQVQAAQQAYQQALSLVQQGPERRFLQRKLKLL